MSRSLVGSSSISTLGSPTSSRSSCSRRRSPPERSRDRRLLPAAGEPEPLDELAALSSLPPEPACTGARPRSPRSRAGPRRLQLATSWVRSAIDTVLPRLTPARRRAATSPSSSRSSVVLPAPLTPTMPMPVARASRQVMRVEQPAARRRAQRHVLEVDARPCRGGPWRSVSASSASRGRRLVGDQGVGGLDPELGLRTSAPAAPRRSQASSLRSRLLRRSSVTAADAVALGAGQHVRRVAAVVGVDLRRRATSQVVVATASRNQRSWVTTTSALPARGRGSAGARPARRRPRRRGGWWARRAAARRGRRRAAVASASRRRSPPESGPTTRRGRPRPGRRCRRAAREDVADARVAGPLVVGGVAEHRGRGPWPSGSRASRLVEQADAAVAAARWSRGPSSTSCRPASTRSSVDLPPPLRPTTPIRSPSSTPRETPSRTWGCRGRA